MGHFLAVVTSPPVRFPAPLPKVINITSKSYCAAVVGTLKIHITSKSTLAECVDSHRLPLCFEKALVFTC